MCTTSRRTLSLTLVLSSFLGTPLAQVPCAPSPAPTGPTIRVRTDAELQSAVRNLASGETILIADGTYVLSNTLHLFGGMRDIAIRGESGDRDAVVLIGQGMADASFGNVPHGFLLSDVSDVLIADLTVRDVYYHSIQVAGNSGATRVTMRNLHLVDAGEQFIKGSTAGPPGPYADDCIVECCLIEFTDRARSYYTNGVDVLAGARWIIRDNVFRRIRAPAGELAGPTVLFWRNSLDTIVERNVFLECDRGVALGLSTPDPGNARDGEGVFDHQGGIVRNNVFYRAAGSLTGDVGLSVNYCRDYAMVHNTVVLEGSFDWAMEYRFDVSDGLVANNLTDGRILQRNGAGGTLQGNITTAQASWFIDQAGGDLHLDAASAAIDQGVALASVIDDLDGDLRPSGPAPDVGADESSSCTLPASPLTGLRVARDGDDLLLGWLPAPRTSLANVWYVTSAADGDLTRLAGSPPAIGVVGCSEPSPATGPACRDAGAVSRASGLHFYRVRPTCGGPNEGP